MVGEPALTNYVFDAGGLSLYLLGDARLTEITRTLRRGTSHAYVSTVNLAEFFYKMAEQRGRDLAETWHYKLLTSTLRVEAPDPELARIAGLLKGKYRTQLSLADAFAAALTERQNGLLITTNPNFTAISEIKHRFLPPA